MSKPLQQHGLYNAYCAPGFITRKTVRGMFGDPKAIILKFIRRQKKRSVAHVGLCITNSTIGRKLSSEICPVVIAEYTWKWRSVVYAVPNVEK